MSTSINCRESYLSEYPWHDGRFCGAVYDAFGVRIEDECACGCTAYDELCDEGMYAEGAHTGQVIGEGGSYRWRCSCGADSSGQWSPSKEEAEKKLIRHIEQVFA